jgi:drug/metabolite transporter (DMT)-like permease
LPSFEERPRARAKTDQGFRRFSRKNLFTKGSRMNAKVFGAAILIVISAVLWGTMIVPIKASEFDPLWMAWVRFLASMLVMCTLNGRLMLRLGPFKIAELGVGLLLTGALLLWTLAAVCTTGTNTVVIFNVAPFVSALIERAVYRRPIRRVQILAMVGMIAGLSVMTGGLSAPRLGDLLTLIAGVCWGVAMPAGVRLGSRYQRAVLLGMVMGLLGVPVLILVRTGTVAIPAATPYQAWMLLWLGGVSAAAYWLHSRVTGWELVSSHTNTCLLMVQVLVMSALSAWLFQEPIGLPEAAGGGLIIGGALVLVLCGDAKTSEAG